jgi:hypothetical protein
MEGHSEREASIMSGVAAAGLSIKLTIEYKGMKTDTSRQERLISQSRKDGGAVTLCQGGARMEETHVGRRVNPLDVPKTSVFDMGHGKWAASFR